MIGYLEGTIKFKTTTSIILMVNGVGYTAQVPTYIITDYPTGEALALFIHTHVKEDALDLFGFSTFEDLTMFELLIGVSGIGPKTALGVFSYGKIEKIKEAVVKGNIDFFTAVPRLGKKNAQKIIIELRPKLGNLSTLDLDESPTIEANEITDALKVFGFSTAEAKDAIKHLEHEEGSTSDKIRLALKYLGKKR
jgi:Holliday junction DNA helicase RuvA